MTTITYVNRAIIARYNISIHHDTPPITNNTVIEGRLSYISEYLHIKTSLNIIVFVLRKICFYRTKIRTRLVKK